MAKTFTLGKNERLKSRKLIEQLFSGGNKFSIAPFRVFYMNHKDAGSLLQFGAGVSVKLFKKAVDRNRIKRLMRETWRLQKEPLKETLNRKGQTLYVFIIFTDKELPVYKDMHEKMNKIINKLNRIIESGK